MENIPIKLDFEKIENEQDKRKYSFAQNSKHNLSKSQRHNNYNKYNFFNKKDFLKNKRKFKKSKKMKFQIHLITLVNIYAIFIKRMNQNQNKKEKMKKMKII